MHGFDTAAKTGSPCPLAKHHPLNCSRRIRSFLRISGTKPMLIECSGDWNEIGQLRSTSTSWTKELGCFSSEGLPSSKTVSAKGKQRGWTMSKSLWPILDGALRTALQSQSVLKNTIHKQYKLIYHRNLSKVADQLNAAAGPKPCATIPQGSNIRRCLPSSHVNCGVNT